MAQFSVVTNIGALNAMNKLTSTNLGLGNTINRLASGLRINGAKDDAAGLAIAENLRADVLGLNQAVRNANDGIGLVTVADAAMGEISNLLQRAMTLAEQASSETSGADSGTAKTALGAEYDAILDEIDRIAATVEFNGTSLLNAAATIDVQIGVGNTSNDRIGIVTSSVSASGLSLTKGNLTTASNAQSELTAIQSAIDSISGDRGDLGAVFNRLEHTISVITVQAENLKAAESQIRDANVAEEVVNLTKFQVLNQTGLASLAQANSTAQSVLSLLR